jgi:hypothetical protein
VTESDDFINSYEGEIILGATFVEIGEVGAHSPFFILLVDHHHICQPLQVGYFFDETCIKQPLELSLHYFYLLFRHFLKLLLSRLRTRIHLQFVFDDIPAYSNEVRG